MGYDNSYLNFLPARITSFTNSDLSTNVIERYNHIAQRYPLNVAIYDSGRYISYCELDDLSNRVAHTLYKSFNNYQKGFALLFDHGADFLITLLGVLKYGVYFSALDSRLSADALSKILKDLNPGVLIYSQEYADIAITLTSRINGLSAICASRLTLNKLYDSGFISPDISSESFAQIIYTSGSTGAPQGVIYTHRNILAIARNRILDFHINEEDVATNICSLSTGASVAEVFGTLLAGAKLCPISVAKYGLTGLISTITQEKASIITAVPSLFRIMCASMPNKLCYSSVRLISLGGDRATKIDFQLFRKNFSDNCLLRIGYGSSEFMQLSQLFITKGYELEGPHLPVGLPMPGCMVTILDHNLSELPIGSCGEIAVTSPFLCYGYWDRPKLTSDRFVYLPHLEEHKFYLTNDVGFFDELGILHYVGRKDSRVKVHGKMIHLGDLESIVLSAPGVKEAVIVPYDNDRIGTELAAYVVSDGHIVTATELTKLLARYLPLDVFPKKVNLVESLPISRNNKINRIKLSQMAGADPHDSL